MTTSPGRPQPAGRDQAAAQELERYLGAVAARLPGPARTRAGIIAELRSGLLDAADAHAATGLAAAHAARAAVREFGDPGQVATGFRTEIAAGQARRVAIALLVTGPLVGALWLTAAVASHLGSNLSLRSGLGLVALAAVVTAIGAGLGIAATGRLTRWRPAAARQAPAAAAVAGFGAVVADAIGLTLLAAQLVMAPGRLAALPVATAAGAGLLRLVLARRAAYRCLAARASLP
jgi:hypothetical protein